MKRTRVLLAVAALAAVAVFPGMSANPFATRISKDQRVLHALNRLTYGPRPGDAAAVRAAGLKKSIDRQLHPERIPENPVLERKLAWLDSLRMTGTQLVENYPPQQVIRQMVEGRVPYPSDPDRRLLIKKLAARYERRQGQEAKNGSPEFQKW